MLRRIQSVLPTRPDLSTLFPFRPYDRNAIFIITNNTPQMVNGIQVQSSSNDVEQEGGGASLTQPNSENCRWARNLLANCFGTAQAQSDQGNLQPQLFERRHPGRHDPTAAQSQGHTSLPIQRGNGRRDELVIIPRSRRHRSQSERDHELEEIGDNSEPQRNSTRDNLPTATVKKQIKLHSIPTFLKVHFDMLYYTGISPINGDGERGSPFQLVAFSIVTVLAMLFTFGRCKLFIVDESKTGDLQDYITAWYFMSSLVLQLGFLWLVVFRQQEVSDVLNEAKTKRPGIRYNDSQQNANISPLSVALASLGIIAALMQTVKLALLANGGITTTKEYILHHSHETSLLFFLWSKGSNGTDNLEVLFDLYGEDVTATTMAMGFLGMMLTFFGILQEIAIKDILLTTALHTFRLGQIFQSNMNQVSQETQPNDQMTSLLCNVHSQLSDMATKLESCFGNFFKLVHADNLLYWAYMLVYFLDGHISGVVVFHGILNLLKIACILYCPAHAIKTTQEVKGVIRRKYCANDPQNDMTVETLKNVILLIQTLEENPISIGSDNFLMDETFALKFIGAAVTFFLFLVDTDKKTQGSRRR